MKRILFTIKIIFHIYSNVYSIESHGGKAKHRGDCNDGSLQVRSGRHLTDALHVYVHTFNVDSKVCIGDFLAHASVHTVFQTGRSVDHMDINAAVSIIVGGAFVRMIARSDRRA